MTGRGRTILAAWGLALAAAAVRLAFAAHLPVFPDEAYYWVWSRHPAPAYFDHPPAIAFLIGGGTALLGDGSLGIRLLPVLAGLVAAAGAIATARHLGGAAAALWTSAILACMPLAAAGLVLATPDAPLLAALALACYALVRAVGAGAGERAALLWWLAAGVALGAAFLSKYTAVLLPVGVLLALLLHDRLRPHLRTAGPWAASALALLLFLPVVAWNARHGWVSFAFQLRHGLASGGGSALVREGRLVGGQLALASPILFGLLVVAVAGALRRRLAEPAPYLLAVTAAVFLGFFAWSALERPVEANWPAPFYLPASVLLALAAADGRWRRSLRRGAGPGRRGGGRALPPRPPPPCGAGGRPGPGEPGLRLEPARRRRGARAERGGGPPGAGVDRHPALPGRRRDHPPPPGPPRRPLPERRRAPQPVRPVAGARGAGAPRRRARAGVGLRPVMGSPGAGLRRHTRGRARHPGDGGPGRLPPGPLPRPPAARMPP